ncbi:VWA domain-containing protein [Gordonia soli]|uniref:VWFA domain-containing protein n=1 Tax=Gordonia soli NBRC 108243 TaxID=1223545 RepID=M0QKE6_9ACTN|nr:vWA domain-containing protein [Gordonia soli]GAC67882.1 hypothetical protein GS4_11_01510 [Gordonia soli NBRC 108243]
MSPDVGELDEEAVADAMAEDADQTMATLIAMSHATDEGLRAAVRRIVPRLVLEQARRGAPKVRGITRRRVVPADRGGDLDVEASLDAVVAARAERRVPALDELRSQVWARPEVALCLVVDASGSMNGSRLATAAVAAAACLLRARGQTAVISFASRPAVLKKMGVTATDARVVDAVLRLRGHGVTAVSAALESARRELATADAARRVVLLLSDCRHTDDIDPVPALRALDEVLILAPAQDNEAALALGRAGGAAVASIESISDVAPAVSRLLAPR